MTLHLAKSEVFQPSYSYTPSHRCPSTMIQRVRSPGMFLSRTPDYYRRLRYSNVRNDSSARTFPRMYPIRDNVIEIASAPYSGRFHVRSQKCANNRPRSTKNFRNLQLYLLLIRLHHHHTICCLIISYTIKFTSWLTYSCNLRSILCVSALELRRIRIFFSFSFQQINIFSDNSNNFFINYRRFQTNDTLKFISRISNIMQQNDEMIFMNEAIFLKWIRQNQIVQIINRMIQIISIRDVVNSIIRTYQYQNNICIENRVNVV